MPAIRVGENTSSVDGDVDTIRPAGEWSTVDKVADGVIDSVQGNHDEVRNRKGEEVESLLSVGESSRNSMIIKTRGPVFCGS